ncbi:SIR2 family protein [Candidatus Eisenbacteria bacterium]|uniref:SIR2 family protein n=1 Tax=Eiseniibacteriota bacterium TaxID=2212470 RepID=A0ABV6YLU4_UNCEI
MSTSRQEAIATLRTACEHGNLTLYLGAGVSVDNGLPTWEQLVLAMYFSAISKQSLGGWRPFPNYLFAIAEWHLENSREPLEITARKLRNLYGEEGQASFRDSLRSTLYGGFLDPNGDISGAPSPDQLLSASPTLAAVTALCSQTRASQRAVKSVITYNYDNLLELALGSYPHQSVFGEGAVKPEIMPVYHVHGFVPMTGQGSLPDDIVFTEDQYHRAARDPYSWSNLVQIRSMAGSIGLMIGLSLTDRNMRRLLDAVSKAPLESQQFILLQRPKGEPPPDEDLDQIHQKAIKYLDRFKRSGIKSAEMQTDAVMTAGPGIKADYPTLRRSRPGTKGPLYQEEIAGIIEQVERLDAEQQTAVLTQLGVTPIWYDEHDEVGPLLDEIRT